MKRTMWTAALILLVMLSLTACGKKKDKEGSSQAGAAQGAGVSAATNVTLPEDGETVAFVLAARMVSDYLGNEAFVSETKAGANTFWSTLGYLVSAYGTQNTKISASEDGQSYEVKLEQLRYYAAALYAELGKAKELPELSEMTTGVARKSKKVYLCSIVDTSQYRATIDSLAETEDGYRINASLIDSTSGGVVAQYAAQVKKSSYTGKKSPFHYAVAGLNRMTKIPMVQILVGPAGDENQAGQQGAAGGQTPDSGQGAAGSQTPDSGQGAAGGQTPDSGQGAAGGQPAAGGEGTGAADGGQASPSQNGGSSSTDGGAPAGGSSSAAAAPSLGGSTGTDSGSSSTDGGASAGGGSSDQGAAQPSNSGGGISNGAALEQARDYFGTTDEESGKAYVYSYEGKTAFNGTDYYNFYVTDGEAYVTNILVSYDGSRILKGTKNADGSWSLQ